MGSLIDSTEDAINAATHLTPMDAGAVEALRELARKIDAWDLIVSWALDEVREGGRPAVPMNDNTSIPTYLRYCDALGLTPVGRKVLDLKKERAGGKLAAVRSIKPKAAG